MINYSKNHPEFKKEKKLFSSLKNIFVNSRSSFEVSKKTSINYRNWEINNINKYIQSLVII